MKTALFVLLSLLSVTYAQLEDRCRALILSGGANKGAYQAGVIYGWTHNSEDLVPAETFQYDFISGVSAGAINTAGLSLFPIGKEKEMGEFVMKAWSQLNTSNIYVSWPGDFYGIPQGLFHESGIFNDQPLVDTLNIFLNHSDGIQRKIVVSSVNSMNGEYDEFTETSAPREEIAHYVAASGSMPTVFPFQPINGGAYIDGGSVWNLNIGAGVDRCLNEKVDDVSLIDVDVIILAHSELDNITAVGNSLTNYLRYHEIKNYYKNINDLYQEQKSYPGVNFRYLAVPSEQLDSGYHEIIFGNATAFPMEELGQKDGRAVLEMGPGKSFDDFNRQFGNDYTAKNVVKRRRYIA